MESSNLIEELKIDIHGFILKHFVKLLSKWFIQELYLLFFALIRVDLYSAKCLDSTVFLLYYSVVDFH